jgi:putative oxidoreductase
MNDSWLASKRNHVLSIVRIVVGFNFMCHGMQKTFGLFGGTRMAPLSLLGVGGAIELAGGLLILLGLLTRPAAFLCSGEMAVAYFKQHAPGGLLPVVNRGELAVVYCFLFLYLVFSGPGPWSLDRFLQRGGRR